MFKIITSSKTTILKKGKKINKPHFSVKKKKKRNKKTKVILNLLPNDVKMVIT
jgi:hypothetical protein